MRGALAALAVLAVALGATTESLAMEPVLKEEEPPALASPAGGPTGNPVVSFRGDITQGRTVRNRFGEAPRWIVSDDLDADGRDEAAVLFADGSLQILYLDRENLRPRASVRGLSPEAPPVVLREFGGSALRGVLVVDTRGALLLVEGTGAQTRRMGEGFSPLTHATVADLDGDGRSEIAGVSDKGRLVLLTSDGTRTDGDAELLPDTRLTAAPGAGVRTLFALSGPSDDFDLGRLGDAIEATSLSAFTWDGRFLKRDDEYALGKDEAIECLVPVLAAGGGGATRILLTVSTRGQGSRLVALTHSRGRIREDRKGPVAEGDAWTTAIAVAPAGESVRPLVLAATDPGGRKGTLEVFGEDLASDRVRLEGKISVQVPSARSTGMGIVGDFDGDGQAELLAPGEDRTTLRVFDFERNRVRSREILTGLKAVSSNLCPGDFDGDGRSDAAVGFEDGGLILFLGR